MDNISSDVGKICSQIQRVVMDQKHKVTVHLPFTGEMIEVGKIGILDHMVYISTDADQYLMAPAVASSLAFKLEGAGENDVERQPVGFAN